MYVVKSSPPYEMGPLPLRENGLDISEVTLGISHVTHQREP